MLESYHSIFIILAIGLLYGLTYGLYVFNKISLLAHRRVWNIILLISFLISGLLGIILAIFLDQRVSISWYKEFLWLHVEFGIAMAIVALFHAGWHWRYYWAILKRKNKDEK